MSEHDLPPEPAGPHADEQSGRGGRLGRRRGLLTVLLALAAVATLIIAARSDGSADTPAPAIAVSQPGRVLPVAQRTVTPTLSGTALIGGQLTLASLRGHVAVLAFWGSWCAPCREEAPGLARLSKET